MALLHTYEDFLARIDALGFLYLSDVLPGFPSVAGETAGEQWHTGEPDTDPWQWKDRAAAEKRAAFGCVLGGHKGFIAPRLYSAFVRACQPDGALEERHDEGLVKPAVWDLWQCFEHTSVLGTNDLNRLWKLSGRKAAGLDGAIRELQREFWITVAGNRRKLDRYGQPTGWAHLLYERVDTWTPPQWLAPLDSLATADACHAILSAARQAAPAVPETAILRALRLPSV